MGFKILDIAKKGLDIVKKGLDLFQKPLEALTSPIKEAVGGLLDKLPFGLGNFIKPIAEKLIDNAAGMLAGGPLGALGTLGQAAKTVGDVAKTFETFKGVADKFGALGSQPALQNFQNLAAFSQAAHIF